MASAVFEIPREEVVYILQQHMREVYLLNQMLIEIKFNPDNSIQVIAKDAKSPPYKPTFHVGDSDDLT